MKNIKHLHTHTQSYLGPFIHTLLALGTIIHAVPSPPMVLRRLRDAALPLRVEFGATAHAIKQPSGFGMANGCGTVPFVYGF